MSASDRSDAAVTLGEGRFLRLVRRNNWEFVERSRPVRAAFIGAVTPGGGLLLTEEFRVPVNAWVIGCPAGLIGDGDDGDEAVEAGVRRELIEEAGYEAGRVRLLTRGPTSAGQCDEVIEIALADDLRKVGDGGGVEGEQIRIVEVPLVEVDAWLASRAAAGRLIDPKVYTVLYFVAVARPAQPPG